jgi:hypothetical protein
MVRLLEAVALACLAVLLIGCGPGTAHPPATEPTGRWEGEKRSGEPVTKLPRTDRAPAPAPQSCPEGEGRNLTAEVKRLFRLVACPEGQEPPEGIDPKVAAAHCKVLRAKMRDHKRRFVAKAAPFLAKLTKGAPEQVVYPFSGGDLVTALTTFPDAKEITTISLELAGDPRIRVGTLNSLDVSLDKLRKEAGEVLVNEHYSRSATLKATQVGSLPGTLSMFLIGLAVHGYEPVELRYFTLGFDGSVQYVSPCNLTTRGNTGVRRKSTWHKPDFAEDFAHAEVRFRLMGDPNAPIRVHRHIAANLNDKELIHFRELIRDLVLKGMVSTMTKAASYLLWKDSFSTIRDYLLDHLTIMVSDSTGIPPQYAEEHDLEQKTYGSFGGALLPASGLHNRDFRALWRSQPRRPLPFRFGYLSRGQRHLLVTRRPKSAPVPAQ